MLPGIIFKPQFQLPETLAHSIASSDAYIHPEFIYIAMLQLAVFQLCLALFLVKLGPALGQLRYELSFERVRDSLPVTLRCRDNSVGTFVDISDVNFWLNRTLPDDPDLRERRDLDVAPGQTGDGLTFALTRSIEGRYTCGRQTDSANVEESDHVFLVGKCLLRYFLTRILILSLVLRLIKIMIIGSLSTTLCKMQN